MAERSRRKAAPKKAAAKKTVKKAAAKTAALAKKSAKKAAKKSEQGVRGYGSGGVDVVMSVDQVAKEAASIAAAAPTVSELEGLVKGEVFLSINDLRAGYGKMEILHILPELDGSVRAYSPNVGKSSVLQSILASQYLRLNRHKDVMLTPSQKCPNK